MRCIPTQYAQGIIFDILLAFTLNRTVLGYYLAEYKTFADLSAATLKALGLKTEKLIAVPTPDVIKDRTYASAIAFRQWLLNSDLKIKSINLYTFDVHSRRSWLLFKQVLAPKIKVGVIATKTLDYEPNKWWTSSEGVRSVISETIAYIYARFLNFK
ncbi:MAG: YdcF family protein [Gloeocapsa sp. UFS-A4-WI-NPMV-4B04]|nr:YdcF family protein [Gloeocapsa sp. UFS-A4-WI-NPMV-4B04]